MSNRGKPRVAAPTTHAPSIGHNGGPRTEPFGLRARWLSFAKEIELRRLAKLQLRIERKQRSLDDLIAERKRIMNPLHPPHAQGGRQELSSRKRRKTMSPRTKILLKLWETGLETEDGANDAIMLLSDAVALGCNEIDADPRGTFERIQESFDTLHIAKHIGRPQ